MNSTERLQKAIAGQPTDMPAVAPAYLSLYLDAQTQRLYRAAYERKLSAQIAAPECGAVSIDHAEDARFRADAILGAYEILGEQPDWIHTHPAETHAWAERGEMRFTEGRWLYVDKETGETQEMDEAGRLWLSTANRYMYSRADRRYRSVG